MDKISYGGGFLTKKLGFLGAFLFLSGLIGGYLYLKRQKKCHVILKNHLKEEVSFELIEKERITQLSLKEGESYFYYPKYKDEALIINLGQLGNKPPHSRVLKNGKEHYKIIYASFVTYEKGYKDLRIRREGAR